MSTLPRTRGQAGVSLIEALIVVVLVSSVVLVFAYGLQTSVTTDGRTNRQQRMSLALSSFSEGLRQAAWIKPCASPGDPVDFAGEATLGAGYLTKLPAADRAAKFGVDGFDVTGVSYWQAGNFTDTTSTLPGQFGTTCDPATGAVVLKIQVTYGGEVLVGEVVKRKPAGLS